MQQILFSTTGSLTTVTINDLGARTFTHPISNVDLLEEFRIEEVRDSDDLQTLINAGHIILSDEDFFVITDLKDQLSNAKLSFDTDRNNVVDNAEQLSGQGSTYYLSRTNHTGTQIAATISNFDTAAVSAIINSPSAINAITSSGTAGWANNAANAYRLNNQTAAYYAVAANTQPLDATLTALAAYNSNGILTQTSADTFIGRTITGTSNKISVTNGDGVVGDPTLNVGSDIVQITQANVYGDFDQTFRSTRLRISNPANTFFYNLTGAAIAANRTITLPLLTGNDTLVTAAFAQTLTNKTHTSPVINTQISGNVTNGGNITTTNFLIGATATQTMSAKTLTSPVINTQISGTVTSGGNITTTNYLIGATATQTLTNKTIDASSNTISNLPIANTTGILAVARGGTGTATPSLVEGTNITITGSWPNQTINASGAGGYATIQEEGTPVTQRNVLNFIGSGITATDDVGNTRTNLSLNSTLEAFSTYNTNGILTQTAANTYTGRTITGTVNKIDVTNGNGVSGNPTLNVGSDIVQITQANTYGAFTQTFRSGNLRLSNPTNTFFYSLVGSAIAADRSVTLPLLTGNDTLVTEAFTQTLTNKTLTSPIIDTQISGTIITGGNITASNYLIGATATQTMSNKTLTSPVINTQITGSVTAGGTIDATNFIVAATATQTLTNKTLTSPTLTTPTINTSIAGTVTSGGNITASNYLIGATATQTLTNKTIDASSNTISNIVDANIATHTTTKISTTNKSLLNTAIVYNDQANTYGDFNQTFRSDRLRIANPANTFFYNFTGSAIAATRSIVLPLLTATDTIVTEAFTQTLTNKTLTSPVINTQISGNITTGGNITTSNYLIGATATQTLTNKTIDGNNNTISNIPTTAINNYFQVATSLGTTATSSTTPVVKLTLTTASLPSGTYRAIVHWMFIRNTAANSSFFDIQLNSVSQGTQIVAESKDTTDNIPFTRILYLTISGVNDISLRFWGESGGNSTTISDASIEIIKVT